MVLILPISCGALATNLLAMCCISHIMLLSNGVCGGAAGISLTSSRLESSVASCYASCKSDIISVILSLWSTVTSVLSLSAAATSGISQWLLSLIALVTVSSVLLLL